MKLLYTVLTLTAVASPFVHAATNCATGPTMMTDIQHFAMGDAISFCPSNICISVIGKLNGVLVAGSKAKFSISAKVGGKEVYTSVQNFCSLIGVCPSSSGFMVVPVPETANFPAHIADFTFKLTNGDGKAVFCQTLTYGTPVPTTTTKTTITYPTPTYTPPPLPPKYPESKNCPNVTTDQAATDLTMTPGNYCPLQPYTLTVTGPMSAPIIDGATLFITGRFIGSVIYRDEANLCELLAAAGTPCPVPATATSWSVERTVKNVPANIPLAYTMSAVNVNGKTLFCRQTTISAKNCTITA